MPAEPVLRVALNLPLRKSFDYCLPVDWKGPLPVPGARLRVPFGSKELIGVLLLIHGEWPDFTLKPVLEKIDDEAVIDQDLMHLLAWTSDYYCHPIGEVIAAALPTRIRQGKPLAHTDNRRWVCMHDFIEARHDLARAPKQQELLDYLSKIPEGATLSQLNMQFAHWRQPMRGLIDKQLVSIRSDPIKPDQSAVTFAGEHRFNPAQQKAFDYISNRLNHFESFLLYGVTGSGKTEVYLQLVRKVLEQGKQALILVPEIGLTPQLAARFKRRFSCEIAVMHSGLNESERANAWLSARNGSARIIIGTRSAVYVPMHSPGIVIIDEEHDASFKQMEGFRYSARDIAIKRASLLNIPVVLGSATPAIESFGNARGNRSTLLQLPERAGSSVHPELFLLDMRGQKTNSGLSAHSLNVISDELNKDGQALIFLNRRGYAPMLRCEVCGWTAECHHCDIRMTVHRHDARLRCHVCSYDTGIPDTCPDCGSRSLHTIGQGTEKVEALLAERFPKTEIIRVDRDTTRAKGSFTRILEKVNAGGRKLLIGTQMLAKGHHFPDIGTVIVLDADNGLHGLDFRSQENMAQLITQVAGRAGRASRPGKVYIQTWHPDHPFFDALRNLPYIEFAERLLAERKLTCMPPYTYLALLRVESTRMHDTETFIQQAAKTAASLQLTDTELLGPAIAPLERKAGFYRMQLLARSKSRTRLHIFLKAWVDCLETIKTGKRVRWSLDIDPYNLY